jgi:uncharacterized protein (DUF2147 family)
MRRILIGLASVVLTVAPVAAAEPVGDWLVKDKTARITIENCANKLWGVISWEQNPGTDKNNPDPSKRDRPMLGVPLLTGLQQTQPNLWEGQIYNPQNGNMYNAKISLTTPDTLKLQGCVLGGLFCGGEDWTRYQAEAAPATAKTKGAPKASICTNLGLAPAAAPAKKK